MIKTLSRYIKGYVKPSVLTPIFMIVEVIMETLIPFLMAEIVDVGIPNEDFRYICKIGIIMVVFAGIVAVYLVVNTEQWHLQVLLII